MPKFVRARWSLLVAALGIGLAARAAAAADLAAHSALYEATLERVWNGAGIIAAQGTMALSLQRACDGWISTMQLVIDTTLNNGRTMRQDMRAAAWESLDGKSYRFSSRQRLANGEMGFKGSARMPDPAAGGIAEFVVPTKKTLTLPKGTLFPIGHMAWLIDQAQAGKHQVVRIVFDGTGGEGAQQAAAFIGARRPAAADAASRLGPLAARPGWPMHLGFYAPDARSPSPEYEVDIFQLDNGVARSMVLGMGTFSVRLRLLKVEALPAPRC